MLLCMLAKEHRKMVAGGTAQIPGGHRRVVCLWRDFGAVRVCLCVPERALSISSQIGAGTSGGSKDVILWTRHSGEN